MHPDRAPEPSALLINGTVGVGKTSVAEAVGALLAENGVPHAVIDLDRLSQSWPTPSGDRFNAGVVEDHEDRQRFGDAVGVDLSVCRLHVELPVVHRRLARRHENEPEALRWHLARSGELAGILDRAAVEDFGVDATTHSVAETAAAVMEAARWQ